MNMKSDSTVLFDLITQTYVESLKIAFRDLIFGGGFCLHLHPVYFLNCILIW